MKTIPKHTLKFIDSWLTLRHKWETYPGFVVAIAKDGKVIFNKAYGMANIESKTAMTTDHVFRVASHSKTFTATAVMQLSEKGKLQLDDPITKHLSWLKKHKDERWRTVTIRQLLSHSAGVIRDGMDADYWQLKREFPSVDQLKAAILEADLSLNANEKLKYSNYGYSLLGMVIEKVSGLSYEKYVTENIVAPLKLKNTVPEYDVSLDLATGYSREALSKERFAFPHINTSAMVAATGFCSTSEDLCVYFSAQIVGSGKLLTDASKREMQHGAWKAVGTIDDESYGIGLDIVTRKGRTLVGHSGGFPGFVTRSYFDPLDKLVVVVLTNAHGTLPGGIAKSLIDIIDEFGDEPPKPEHLKYEGRYVGLHGVCEVIASCNGLRVIYPNSWWPLGTVDKLEVVDDATLKIIDAGSYDNIGELIQYERNAGGKITAIRHSGSYMPVSIDGDIKKAW